MNKKELVSFKISDNIDGPYFVAQLSNGQEIYEDKREKEPHAWVRLKAFISANPGLKIVGLNLIENGHTFIMPKDQRGYCFGKKKTRVFLCKVDNIPKDGVCVGYFDGVVCKLFWLFGDGEPQKEERSESAAGFFLIKNNDE